MLDYSVPSGCKRLIRLLSVIPRSDDLPVDADVQDTTLAFSTRGCALQHQLTSKGVVHFCASRTGLTGVCVSFPFYCGEYTIYSLFHEKDTVFNNVTHAPTKSLIHEFFCDHSKHCFFVTHLWGSTNRREFPSLTRNRDWLICVPLRFISCPKAPCSDLIKIPFFFVHVRDWT